MSQIFVHISRYATTDPRQIIGDSHSTFISREDTKDESPKIGETNFCAGDAFPLKKDDKSLKTKLVTEDKKSAQKPLEPAVTKKPVEVIKKTKREKRDGSTDSEDSDGESKYYLSFDKYNA